MDYKFEQTETGKTKVKEEFTPARRWSFLVGKNETSHTAQSRLVNILANDEHSPTLAELEQAFNIETVTKEFFIKYRDLFIRTKEELDKVEKSDAKIKADFEAKGVNVVDFAKKLLGQIVFLYFLQKKGWFGVGRDATWGTGPKNFLRLLFAKNMADYKNFFNDILEPLFYEALAIERTNDFYSRFNCKIPFLNGGLFDPINSYDWVHTDILLLNKLFSNEEKTKEGDIGTGIFDVFDRYNFTVREDEPLEKEVAIDPEMLGKVFENLLEVKDRKSKGTYYTPREIVHYMCQESLINHLDVTINPPKTTVAEPAFTPKAPIQKKLFGDIEPRQLCLTSEKYQPVVPIEDIESFIRHGDIVIEHDLTAKEKHAEKSDYNGKYKKYKLPEDIRTHAKLIDNALTDIKICDPAIGSGAFPVGMMHEIVRARQTLTTYLGNTEERTLYNFKRHAIQESLYGVDIDPGAVEIAKLRLWLSLVVDEEEYQTIKPLPNLDYKIICGNSLLEVKIDLSNSHLFEEMEKLKPLYFDETNLKRKKELKQKIDSLIGGITENNKLFDFEVYFSEVFHHNGGFDVVIANPPYVSALNFAEIYGSDVRNILNSTYQSARGTYDIYILFMEKGINILKQRGLLTFITPNKYLSAKYGSAFRDFINNNAKISQVVDLSAIRVFEEAAVYPIISIIENTREQKQSITALLPRHRNIAQFNLQHYDITEMSPNLLGLLPEKIWGFLLSRNVKLLPKILSDSKPLEWYGNINATSTAAEAEGYGSLISKNNSKGSVKIVNTGTIDKYSSLWGNCEITHSGKRFLKPYLPLNNTIINNRRKQMYMSPKIIFAKMAKECEALLDLDGEYASINTNCFYSPNSETELEFIGAFCNSKLFMFIYELFFGSLRMSGGYYQFQAPQLRVIPLKNISKPKQRPFVELVRKIVTTKKRDPNAETSTLERQIDEMVYKLYDLTPEEIAIVEGRK
jgi:hypothetical protein